MIKIIAALILAIFTLSAQESLQVMNFNSSNFPDMNAEVYLFDSNYQPIYDNNVNSYLIRNNGLNSVVNSVNFNQPVIKDSLSIIIAFDLALNINDEQNNLTVARMIVNELVKRIDYYDLEFAIVGYDNLNYLVCDYTKDRNKIINSLNNLNLAEGSFFDAALIDEPLSALKYAKKSNRDVAVVLITDGTGNAQTQEIIAEANESNINIHPVIIDKPIAKVLKDIAIGTNSLYFDNVTVQSNLVAISNAVVASSFGYSPSEIAWRSERTCQDTNYTSITYIPILEADKFNFVFERANKPALVGINAEGNDYLGFSGVPPGQTKPLDFSIVAVNSDVFVRSMSIGDPRFTITQGNLTDFTIMQGSRHDIRIEYAPTDSLIVFTTLDIDSDACEGNEFYITGGFPNKPPKEKTIKMDYPNSCGTSFIVGETVRLRWLGLLPEDIIQLEYSVDAGITWDTLAKDAKNLYYDWVVPDSPSDECLIRIIQLWPNNVGRTLTLRHQEDVNSGFFNEDGTRAITSSNDNRAIIWNSNEGVPIHILDKHTDDVLYAVFSPDGTLAATASRDRSIIIWDANTGDSLRTLTGHSGVVRSVNFCACGDKIVSASSDGTARIWDTFTGAEISRISSPRFQVVWYAEFNPTNDDEILIATNDGIARTWNVSTGLIADEFDNRVGSSGNVIHSTYNYDATKIAVTSASTKRVYVWDLASNDTMFSVTHEDSPDDNRPINSSSFYFDGSNSELLLTSAIDNSRLWNANTGAPVDPHIFKDEHTNFIRTSMFNFDASRVITASWDSTAKIWNLNQRDLQMDTTDCFFRIGYPDVIVEDLYLGEVLIGSARDTVINPFLINNADFSYLVEDITLSGNDATSFIIGNPDLVPFHIDSAEQTSYEFRFEPSREGTNQAEYHIKIPTQTITASISGYGIRRDLETIADYLDFGEVAPGDFKDVVIDDIIRNASNTSVTIDSILITGLNKESFKIVDNVVATNLSPGESIDLALRFSPSTIGFKNALLNFYNNSNINPAKINLLGTSNEQRTDSIRVFLAESMGNVGETVKVPIFYELLNSDTLTKEIRNLNMTLSFNATMLEPNFPLISSIIDNNGTRTINFNFEIIQTENTLNELEFKVGLGNSISTDLNIVSLTPNENFPISIEYESGTFDLSDYCENGDEIRLFDPTGRLILHQNTPNPAAETTQINFEILENGFTKLYITDILGRNVLSVVESNLVSGEYSYEIDLTNIPVGSYNYILETPTQRVVKRMDVNK